MSSLRSVLCIYTSCILYKYIHIGLMTAFSLTLHDMVSPSVNGALLFYIVNLAEGANMFDQYVKRTGAGSVPTMWVQIPLREEKKFVR